MDRAPSRLCILLLRPVEWLRSEIQALLAPDFVENSFPQIAHVSDKFFITDFMSQIYVGYDKRSGDMSNMWSGIWSPYSGNLVKGIPSDLSLVEKFGYKRWMNPPKGFQRVVGKAIHRQVVETPEGIRNLPPIGYIVLFEKSCSSQDGSGYIHVIVRIFDFTSEQVRSYSGRLRDSQPVALSELAFERDWSVP